MSPRRLFLVVLAAIIAAVILVRAAEGWERGGRSQAAAVPTLRVTTTTVPTGPGSAYCRTYSYLSTC